MKGRIWTDAIRRALDRRTKNRTDKIAEIDALAEKLLDAVASGDLPAIKEFGDRLEGKPAQAVSFEHDPSGVPIKLEVLFKKPE